MKESAHRLYRARPCHHSDPRYRKQALESRLPISVTVALSSSSHLRWPCPHSQASRTQTLFGCQPVQLLRRLRYNIGIPYTATLHAYTSQLLRSTPAGNCHRSGSLHLPQSPRTTAGLRFPAYRRQRGTHQLSRHPRTPSLRVRLLILRRGKTTYGHGSLRDTNLARSDPAARRQSRCRLRMASTWVKVLSPA
jgi:hypothetical protein